MLYRDFVEQIKDAAEALVYGLRGGRDLTPMLHLESGGMVESAPLDPAFFETRDGRRALTDVVIQLARGGTLRSGEPARQVAWTFTGTLTIWPSTHPCRMCDGRGARPAGVDPCPACGGTGVIGEGEGAAQEVLLAVCVDRERYEIWRAPLRRRDDAPPQVGGWTNMANRGHGFLVTPIQEALR